MFPDRPVAGQTIRRTGSRAAILICKGLGLSNILDEILASKREEVERARRARPLEDLKSQPGYFWPRRNFYGAVAVPRRRGPNLIAEIKRASPSAGLIRADFDPVAVARQYAAGGAQALSVLTDQQYFGGRLEYIEQVKAAVELPVLRKDFLVDAYQVHESRAAGADAVLVIAEALDMGAVGELVGLARALELWVLLEVHTRERLLEVLQSLPKGQREGVLIGVNNRDLQAQQVDLGTTEALARIIPPGMPIVAESGIRTRRDVERMHAAGARALLVGERLMRSKDPQRTIRELFG
uniref:Indole-3-glycerol phosphate synthase n=1 Tax=uncultured Planctomycetota bacterium TaxID=120965 RepID=A0A5B8KFF5_9BACT|nr:indole-3-glycerol phosphate synthase [uncultured Planctomycetota bacterium]